jgi:hypothetical protein
MHPPEALWVGCFSLLKKKRTDNNKKKSPQNASPGSPLGRGVFIFLLKKKRTDNNKKKSPQNASPQAWN